MNKVKGIHFFKAFAYQQLEYNIPPKRPISGLGTNIVSTMMCREQGICGVLKITGYEA